jgi:hypothetical protein
MKDRKKILNNLISDIGLEKTANMVGLSNLDLIRRSDTYIDLTIANDILSDLFREQLFPVKYKNCRLSFDKFEGTVVWSCNWNEDNYNGYENEETYTLATPFWDILDGIPVETESYDISTNGPDYNLANDDLGDDAYTFIKWKDGFENLASYSMWIRRFYLPQVYNVIQKHLNNYRSYDIKF